MRTVDVARRAVRAIRSHQDRSALAKRWGSPGHIIFNWVMEWLSHHQISPDGIQFDEASERLTFPEGFSVLFPDHKFIGPEVQRLRALIGTGKCTASVGDDNALRLTCGSCTFRIMTAEEIYIAHEIILGGTYNLKLLPNSLVLDVGMNAAFASIYFASMPEVAAVIGYEPFPETVEAAKINLSENMPDAGKVATRSYGLGATKTTLRISYTPEKRGSMSVKGQQPWVDKSLLSYPVDVTIEDVAKEWQFIANEARPVFVKFDCEGAEYEIVETLDNANLLKHIYGFAIEWHQRGPEPLTDILHRHNFTIHGRPDPGGHIGMIYAFRAA